MRKVMMPIHIKLNTFIIGLLSCALVFYVFYAINLFEKDKFAYVYDTIRSHNQALSDSLSKDLIRMNQIQKSLQKFSSDKKYSEEIFTNNPNLFAYLQGEGKQLFHLIALDNDAVVRENLKQMILSNIPTLKSKKDRILLLENKYVLFSLQGEKWGVSIWDQSIFPGLNHNSRLFINILLDQNGIYLAGNTSLKINESIFKQIEKLQLDKGTISTDLEKEEFILSFQRIDQHGLMLLTLVQANKALEASAQLKNKSVFFGMFVLSATVLLVLLFSRVFTNPIRKLFEASIAFGQKNFAARVNLRNRDELGALGDSFNTMADSIVDYMKEMKEKHRLENELKTAQLVQKSFFPIKNLNRETFSFASYYSPASECGGDWWGLLEGEDRIIFILIDATGHGTAAALLTAVIHNCLNGLRYLSKHDTKYIDSPAVVMDFLNSSVCQVQSSLMATSFVGIFYKQTGKLDYTNASHDPCFILPVGDVNKSSMRPLIEANGNRLGQEKDSKYEIASELLAPGETLLMYTDGLFEAKNKEQVSWGKRRFIKVMERIASSPVNILVDLTIKHLQDFLGDSMPNDDITFLALRHGPNKINAHGYGISEGQLVKPWANAYSLVSNQEPSDVLIYEGTLANVLAQLNPKLTYKHIINVNSDGRLSVIRENLDNEKIYSLEFGHEKVGEVSARIQTLLQKIELPDQFSDVKTYMQVIGLELVQNSLIYGKESSEQIKTVLKFRVGDEKLVIEAEDYLGALTQEKVFEKLKRSFSEQTVESKASGAGLGLSIVLKNVDKMIFTIRPGNMTRISCVINKYKRLKDFKQKNISLHFDIEEA